MPTFRTANIGSFELLKMSKRMRPYGVILNSLDEGEIVEVIPDEGELIRGIKLNLSRAALLLRKPIETVDNGEAVFVRLVSE